MIYDITEQKKAEEVLLKQETYLRQVESLASIGRWESDLDFQNIYWSEGLYKIFELDPTQGSITKDFVIALTHPDDKEKKLTAYNNFIKEKIPYTFEHRIILKNGNIKWVNEVCRIDYDIDGKPIRCIGIIQDITKRLKTEEALRFSETTMKAIFDNSYESFIFISPKKKNFILQ